MLYEVITFTSPPFPSHPKWHGSCERNSKERTVREPPRNKGDSHDNHNQQKQEHDNPRRITSYNVCYTKLLRYTVLIEDDGLGMAAAPEDIPAEHAGLAIMRERAAKLPGQMVIESEPGEGTRIVLIFNAPPVPVAGETRG